MKQGVNLFIPQLVVDEMKKQAQAGEAELIDTLRRYIKYGLLIDASREQGAKIILRENGTDREIVDK